MKWAEKTYTCIECGQPRPPGRRRCKPCHESERREKYLLDPRHRQRMKQLHNNWREANLPRRAEYMREWRAKQKEKDDQPTQ